MKTADYINALVKENEEFKKLCISHVKTINLQKKEILNLNNTILKKDKKIKSFESDQNFINLQLELENVKSELDKLKIDYANLQNKYDKDVMANKKTQRGKSEISKLKEEYNALKREYDGVVQKNKELMQIFNDIENEGDSDK